MKYFVILFTTLFFVLSWNYLRLNDIGSLTLDDRPKFPTLNDKLDREFLKDSVITGEFVSKYNKLGIIGIRFETFNRINTDWIEFKLREAGGGEYYYTAKYKTDQFQPKAIFPIGFPIIENSKDKTYQFELRSISGTTRDSVAISSLSPNFIVRHVYTKRLLLNNLSEMAKFIHKKLINITEYPGFNKYVTIYAIPLIALLIIYVTNFRLVSFLMIILGLAAWDIFFAVESFDYLYFSAISIWMLACRTYKMGGESSGLITLLFFLSTVVLLKTRNFDTIEKMLVWATIFLFIAFIQRILAYPGKNQPYHGPKFFLSKIRSETMVIHDLIEGILVNTQTHLKPNNIKQAYTTVTSLLHSIVSRNKENVDRLTAVTFLGVSFLYLLIIKGLYTIVHNLFEYSQQYKEYYIQNQSSLFLKNTGVYLLCLYIFSILLFTFSTKKLPNIRKIIIALIIILFTITSGEYISKHTANFKDKVIIWSVRGNNTAEPWVDVFIDGRNLGEPPELGKVLVHGVEQRVIKWTRNEIIFRTNPVVTVSGKVQIVTNDGRKSNELDFKYSGNR